MLSDSPVCQLSHGLSSDAPGRDAENDGQKE